MNMMPVILPLDETKAGYFAFPAIPPCGDESPAENAPKAIWPKCGSAAAMHACVNLAEAICNLLPPGRPTVLALTSPGDGDGKTTLLAALAPELARRTAGGVLAIDADFRRWERTRTVATSQSLTARLTLSASRTSDNSHLIYPTNVAGLSVLPVRTKLQARRFDPASIGQFRENWPLVLLDAASLEHAETASLVGRCDGVCLVVRVGYTIRRAVAKANRVIHSCGGRLLGCVVVGG